MAPIDINNQEISSITLNGNTDIGTVTVNGQTVFSSSVGDDFNDNSFSADWSTSEGSSGGDSFIREANGELQIRANAGSSSVCGINSAKFSGIGSRSGQITISYDWQSYASGWYEMPETQILEDGNAIESESHSPGFNGNKSGSDSIDVTVDGVIEVVFRVRPSSVCTAGDHNYTGYNIDNLVIS